MNDLTLPKEKENIAALLNGPTLKIAELITGVLSSERRVLVGSVGHLVQGVLQNRFLITLAEEIKRYQKEGKIKKDFLSTDLSLRSFRDLLQAVDGAKSDQEKLLAMKSLFFRLVEDGINQDEEILCYELLKICRQLDGSDIQILIAAFSISQGKGRAPHVFDSSRVSSAAGWFNNIAAQIGHNVSDLVEMRDEKLISLKLLVPRIYSDRSGVEATKHFRLTPLGFKLCQYIQSPFQQASARESE